MGKRATILNACVLCAVSFALVAVPALADHISPAREAKSYLGIIVVAVAASLVAFLLIAKRKR